MSNKYQQTNFRLTADICIIILLIAGVLNRWATTLSYLEEKDQLKHPEENAANHEGGVKIVSIGLVITILLTNMVFSEYFELLRNRFSSPTP